MSYRINARDSQWWLGDTTSTLLSILKYAPGNHIHVYLPYEDGDPWWMPKEGIFLNRPIELWGDGHDEANGLRFYADPAIPELRGTGDSHGLILGWHHIYLHDLTISNNRGMPGPEDGVLNGISRGSGVGIGFYGTPAYKDLHDVIGEVILERVGVFYAGKHGFLSHPPFPQAENGGYGFLVITSMKHCQFYQPGENGVRVDPASTTLELEQINIQGSGTQGLVYHGSINGAMRNVIAENCGRFVPAGMPDNCTFLFRDCEGMDLRLYTENFSGVGGAKDAIIFDNVRQSYLRPSAIYEWNKPDLVGVRMRSCTKVTVETQATNGLKYSVYDEGRKSKGCTIHAQESPVSISTRYNDVSEPGSR